MRRIEFIGIVFSGQGEGRRFLKLSWVSSQIHQRLGFKPTSGTLNIKLSENSKELRRLLVENAVFRIKPSGEYCEGLLFKASLSGLECGVIIPEVENYPCDVLELISPLNLRKKLQLRNGDQVTVAVDI